jgi:hypothetical protein
MSRARQVTGHNGPRHTQSGEKRKNRQRQEWDSNPGFAEGTYHCTTTLLVKQFGNKYYILQI